MGGAIPTKIVKLANKQICKTLANYTNESIKQNKFRNELKMADIRPLFKQDNFFVAVFWELRKMSGNRFVERL